MRWKWCLVSAVLLLASCGKQDEPTSTSSFDLDIRPASAPFLQSISLVRAVSLASHEDAVVGSVYEVRVSETSGDLLVGDYRSQKKVFRFAQDGTFITSYGKVGQGPGEYHGIADFVVLPDDSIVVLTDLKMIRYARSGEVISEVTSDVFTNEIVFEDGLLFVRNGGARAGVAFGALSVYDQALNAREHLGDYDSRLDKFSFWSRIGLASRKKEVAYCDNFGTTLHRYSIPEKKWFSHEFPNQAPDLGELWEKEHFSGDDERGVLENLHAVMFLFGLEQGFFFREYYWAGNLDRYGLFVPETNTLIQFENDTRKNRAPGPWNYLVGSTGTQLIGVLDDETLLHELSETFPSLNDLTLEASDNPILLFFALKPVEAL